jgi:3-oxoacyl-[acyl-carrier protein] reductase
VKRLAVVTGGTKGLGREISLAFGRAGYDVLALYASDRAAADELTAAFAQAGIQGSAVQHDITSTDAAIWSRPEIAEAEKIVLIHNACAPFSPTPLHQLPWAEFEQNFNVAVKGGWACSQALLRPMIKKGGGTIVNVLTSALEGSSPKGFSAYLTAKHALRGLTLAQASEFSARGIRVFTVSPGYMDTALTARWDDRLRDSIRSNSSRITDPAIAAARIVALVEDTTLAGQGEDYPL